MMDAEHIVIVAPTMLLAIESVRELGIPHHALTRHGRVHLVTEETLLETVRGIPHVLWCVLPGERVSDVVRAEMAARRGCQVSFHEALARHLAWRTWHDQ